MTHDTHQPSFVGNGANGRRTHARKPTSGDKALLGLAVAFAVAAGVSLIAPAARFQLGPVRVSLGDPSRVAFQAALVLLVATLTWPFRRHRKVAVMLAIALTLAAAIVDSSPRRVGDGVEYVAMSMNILRGRGPALSDDDSRLIADRLSRTPGFESSVIEGGLAGDDGRRDYPHFWLYSLVAAAFMAATDALAVHPTYAFTAVNLIFVMALASILVARNDYLLAGLLAAGPLVWWVDKAHAEVFVTVLVAVSVYCFEWKLGVSLLAASLAATQNPAVSGLLAIHAVRIVAVGGPRLSANFWVVALSIAVASVNPAYYLLRLGRVSPLLESGSITLPGLRAFLTPLFDPNLGLLWYAPVFCVAVIAGVATAPRVTAVSVLGVWLLLLAAFTHTHNVNHGGTPGLSRYALWLMAAAVPLAQSSLRRVDSRRPVVAALSIGLTAVMSWTVFRPALPERNSPSAIAAALWRYWPSADAPLPEVFAERSSGVDGAPPVPIDNGQCSKILVRGDGVNAVFPFPCEPLNAPEACVAAGALCYVSEGRYSAVPNQSGFGWGAWPGWSWTVRTKPQLAALRTALGSDARTVMLGKARRVVTGTGVAHLWVVEGSEGAATWVYPLAGKVPLLTVRLTIPADVRVENLDGRPMRTSVRLDAGDHVVALEGGIDALVVLVDAHAPE